MLSSLSAPAREINSGGVRVGRQPPHSHGAVMKPKIALIVVFALAVLLAILATRFLFQASKPF
jgi:hypothetical protein